MTDSTSLDDKSQCLATVEHLSPNSESNLAMAQGGERDRFEGDYQSKGSDKTAMVAQNQPDDLETSRSSTLKHVFDTETTMHERKVHQEPEEGKLMEAKGVTTPPYSGHSKGDHSTTHNKNPNAAPTMACKGLLVKEVCPEDADRIAWYSLILCGIFCVWGGLMYWSSRLRR